MSEAEGPTLLTELVYLSIKDVGKAIDVKKLESPVLYARLAGKKMGSPLPLRKDTPTSLALPQPIWFAFEDVEAEGLGRVYPSAKVYNDGAVTILLRGKGRFTLDELGPLSHSPLIKSQGYVYSFEDFANRLFGRLLDAIGDAIIDPTERSTLQEEHYLAYCFLDYPEPPTQFIEHNRQQCASLLIGEIAEDALHESQIQAALAQPFSYRPDDLAIFDMDHCLIFDHHQDYEDILLIMEHANYRLLELRALDRLLDVRLDEAERDLTVYGIEKNKKSSGRIKLRGRTPQRKFARIQALRFEALFILENLENSSKIIGDYFLGQIYTRLCEIFNTEGWSRSVERRLDVLSSVYEMVKTDSAERRTLVLEIVFIIVCIVLPLLQIWQALILK
ncbi:hypothetical protein [Gracilinema caldarium]|uniref:DUF155 domain-containing protein n=1 Tax=Gracilinema caldarium (strain ATCC 51460 / DSM 7334 / H1) TaxID=744872 RepID=F8F402_GRAC1|nr:hypothetical protein [Gracilinema caldarium]AEJ20021.1 hypothetical protein Spica_1888 [Gracilinema caldarium DSM 7334]